MRFLPGTHRVGHLKWKQTGEAAVLNQEIDGIEQFGEPVYDVTFENVQAGERTSHLFRLANQNGGLVLGTGDLSEIALGWSTYGVGDQMSHYNVTAPACSRAAPRATRRPPNRSAPASLRAERATRRSPPSARSASRCA